MNAERQGGFFKVPHDAWRRIEEGVEDGAEVSAKLTYTALCRVANLERSNTFTKSTGYIGKIAGTTSKTIKRRLPDLRRLELIETEPSEKGGPLTITILGLSAEEGTLSPKVGTASDPHRVPLSKEGKLDRKEFEALAQEEAVQPGAVDWAWKTLESNGWVDRSGNPIKDVRVFLRRTRDKWKTPGGRNGCETREHERAGRKPNRAPKLSVWETTKRIEAIDVLIAELKRKGGMEAAFGFEWTDEAAKEKFRRLSKTKKELRTQLAEGGG